MKHFNFRLTAAALLLYTLTAVFVGCGGKADEVLSLAQDNSQSGLTAEEQAAAQEAESEVSLHETSGGTQDLEASDSAQSAGIGTADGQETAGVAEYPEDASSDAAGECLAVYICGAVLNPGVYEVAGDTRLVSLVELAGGFAADADETWWNLARKLDDGAMYYIPTVTETADENFSLPTGEGDAVAGGQNGASTDSSGNGDTGDSGSGGTNSGSDGSEGSAGGQTGSTDQSSGTDGLVSINTATQDELTTLPGIGATKAAAIITYRETNGPFTSINEIMNVTGIGESTYEKLKDYICL